MLLFYYAKLLCDTRLRLVHVTVQVVAAGGCAKFNISYPNRP